jgi:hypothetical protein
MHPHNHRFAIRLLLMGLLIAALIVLFPITARSHRDLVQLAFALL